MTHPTCKTCKHFTEKGIFGWDSPDTLCTNPLFDQSNGKVAAGGMAIVMDDPYTGAHILVSPDFGCIHHEERA